MSKIDTLLRDVVARLVWRERLHIALVALTAGIFILATKVAGSWLPAAGQVVVLVMAGAGFVAAIVALRLIEKVNAERGALLIDSALGLKERIVSYVSLAATEDTGRREFIVTQVEPLLVGVTSRKLVPLRLQQRIFPVLWLLCGGVLLVGALLFFRPNFKALNAAGIKEIQELLDTTALPEPVVAELQTLKENLESASVSSAEVSASLESAAQAVADAEAGAAGTSAEVKPGLPRDPNSSQYLSPTPTPTPSATPTVNGAPQKEDLPPETDVQNDVSSGEPQGEKEQQKDSQAKENQGKDNQGKESGDKSQKSSEGKDGKEGDGQEERSESGKEGGEGSAKPGEGKDSKGGEQAGKDGQAGEQSKPNQGGEKGEAGAEQESGADKQGGGEQSGLEKAKEAIDKLKKEAAKGEQEKGADKKDQQGKEPGKEKGKEKGGDKGSPDQKGQKGKEKGDQKSPSEGGDGDGKSPETGAESGDGKKPEANPGSQSPDGKPRDGEGKGNKEKPDGAKNKGDKQDGANSASSDKDGKDNQSQQGVAGDRNERARDFSELPGGKDGGGVKGEKGFKDVNIKDEAPEKFDSNFTGKEEEKAENKGNSGARTTLDDVRLAKPDPVTDNQVQPVPLEYREVLR